MPTSRAEPGYHSELSTARPYSIDYPPIAQQEVKAGDLFIGAEVTYSTSTTQLQLKGSMSQRSSSGKPISGSSPQAVPLSLMSNGSSMSMFNTAYAKSKLKLLLCGFSGGLVQAALFNPWDRALYLSIKKDRPFLSSKNFLNPFAGVFQTLFQRAISSGLYFPLEEIFADMLIASGAMGEGSSVLNERRQYVAFSAGLMAGSLNGLIVNPLAAVKYHYWGTETGKENFLSTGSDMLRKGGFRIFLVGTTATVLRDLVFGGTYGLLRHELHALSKKQQYAVSNASQTESTASGRTGGGSLQATSSFFREKPTFMQNIVAACMATVLSSPWNYVRNIHYGTPSGTKPQTFLAIWQELSRKAGTQKSALDKIFFLQTQLRVGWGTARVGCGMAVSSSIYDAFSKMLA